MKKYAKALFYYDIFAPSLYKAYSKFHLKFLQAAENIDNSKYWSSNNELITGAVELDECNFCLKLFATLHWSSFLGPFFLL